MLLAYLLLISKFVVISRAYTFATTHFCRMTKEEHLSDLREQYIYLSRLYLQKLQEGKRLKELDDLKSTIETLVREIEVMENDLNTSTET